MAKNTETGKFIPDASGDNQGKFVDNTLNTIVETGTHFFDAAIIPTVQYQVYGLDNVWFWDNEGQSYTFSGQASTIKIQVVNGLQKTYYKVGTLSLTEDSTITEGGTEIDSSSTVPANAKVGNIYYTLADTTKTYYVVTASLTETTIASEISNDKGVITSTSTAPAGSVAGEIYHTEADILSPAEATANSPYEFNKYGKEPNGKEILVSIKPNQTLVNKYPGAIVTINGQEHDLAYLASITSSTDDSGDTPVTTYTVGAEKPIRLYMDKDYRISINWVWGSVVETFRIICNR